MNKTEFTKKLASRLSVSVKEAQQFMNVYEETLGEVVLDEGYMVCQGFGTYTLWQQTERMGRNPKTGVNVLIPARNSIKFKPGKELLMMLNRQKKAKW